MLRDYISNYVKCLITNLQLPVMFLCYNMTFFKGQILKYILAITCNVSVLQDDLSYKVKCFSIYLHIRYGAMLQDDFSYKVKCKSTCLHGNIFYIHVKG